MTYNPRPVGYQGGLIAEIKEDIYGEIPEVIGHPVVIIDEDNYGLPRLWDNDLLQTTGNMDHFVYEFVDGDEGCTTAHP